MALRKDPLARILLGADEEHFGGCTLPADDDSTCLIDRWHAIRDYNSELGFATQPAARLFQQRLILLAELIAGRSVVVSIDGQNLVPGLDGSAQCQCPAADLQVRLITDLLAQRPASAGLPTVADFSRLRRT